MKYTRTKDGRIHEIEEGIILTSYPAQYLLKNGGNVSMLDVFRASDSIEELCDCYVVYEKAGGFAEEHHIYNDLELAKYAANEYVSIVYGAIWTDKGLIYVAKMNEKLELELL